MTRGKIDRCSVVALTAAARSVIGNVLQDGEGPNRVEKLALLSYPACSKRRFGAL